MKIYELKNNYDDFSHFIEMRDYFVNDTWGWNSPVLNKTYRHEMGRSNKNLKNFKLDVSRKINYLILSDKARKLFELYGTFFEIETDSKRKKFHGFFPNKCIVSNELADLRISEYEISENGKLNLGNFFFKKEIESLDLDLFVVEGSSYIYVTDRFKEKLEKEGLGGFSFNAVVYDSSQENYVDWKLKVIKEALESSKWSRIVRSAYKFNDDVTSFESIVENRFLVEEQPFLELYEQYKDLFYVDDLDYPTISKYEAVLAKNKNLLEQVNKLREFFYFLREKNIFLKNKYLVLFPKVKYFNDGAMVGGHFAKGLKQDEDL